MLLFVSIGWGAVAKHYNVPDYFCKWEVHSDEELMDMGRNYLYVTEHTDSALACFSIVASHYRDNMSSEQKVLYANAENNCGYVYLFAYFDYPQAYTHLQSALDICEDTKNMRTQALVHLNLADLYASYAQQLEAPQMDKQALELYSKSVREAVSCKDWTTAITSFVNIAGGQTDTLHIGRILKEVDYFLTLQIPDTVPMLQYAQLCAKSAQYVARGDIEGAIELQKQQSEVISALLTPDRYRVINFYNISQLYCILGKYDMQQEFLNKAYLLSKEKNLSDLLPQLAFALSEYYEKQGNKERSQKYRIEYLELKEALTRDHGLEALKDMRFIYELRKVEEQKAEMKRTHERQQSMLIVALLVIALAIAFLYVLYRKNHTLNAKNESLYLKNQELLQYRRKSAANDSTRFLTDDKKELLATAIRNVLENDPDVFTFEFSLDELANKIGSNSRYVSHVINERMGMTFSALLNNYRIEESCRRLSDLDNYGNLTIEAIAQSVGFHSKAGFTSAFKRVTGMLPSEYQRQAKLCK